MLIAFRSADLKTDRAFLLSITICKSHSDIHTVNIIEDTAMEILTVDT